MAGCGRLVGVPSKLVARSPRGVANIRGVGGVENPALIEIQSRVSGEWTLEANHGKVRVCWSRRRSGGGGGSAGRARARGE